MLLSGGQKNVEVAYRVRIDRYVGLHDAGLNCPFLRDLRRELKQLYMVNKYT